MVFSDEDKVLIKNLYLIEGYGARKLISEFPEKNREKGGLEKLLKKLREMSTVERKKGSGRPKTARTAENVLTVDELAQSQEIQPQSHRSVRQIISMPICTTM